MKYELMWIEKWAAACGSDLVELNIEQSQHVYVITKVVSYTLCLFRLLKSAIASFHAKIISSHEKAESTKGDAKDVLYGITNGILFYLFGCLIFFFHFNRYPRICGYGSIIL